MRIRTRVRRIGTVAGATVAAVALAAPSYAHHCYKEHWTDAAHAAVSSGTAWMSMTDFVHLALTEELGLPEECAAHSNEFVKTYMANNRIAQEPLIHARATVGGGAAHKKGFEPPPFKYLNDADFGQLEALIFAEEDCSA